jgi:hypothetical protein
MKVIEAIKKIYPTIQGGFVYWQTNQDGSSLVNPIDGLIWENAEFTKPTWEQIEAQWIIVNKELNIQDCKNKAKQLISNTDWSVLPDVNITNKSEFESYRNILRNYIINPIENPEFPIEPQPIWSVE